MSTRFIGEGNIGSDPIVKMFPDNGNQPPRGVMRLNVRFDNLVPTEHGLIDRIRPVNTPSAEPRLR